jgi:hypothetical protein
MKGWLMKSQIGEDKRGRWSNRGTILALVWLNQGKPWKVLASIDGVPADIRTERLPNKTLERNRYANLLGRIVLWYTAM